MKPYFDTGLRELARVSGYPVAAIQTCCQFKCTHHFLMEAWQALYQVMLQRFIEADAEAGNPPLQLTHLVQNASLHIKSCDFVATLTQLREKLQQSNWKFWVQFVFEDALAYTLDYS